MRFYRFINYFFNFISIRWIFICFFGGLTLWVFAFCGEAYIRIQRGEEIDDHFLNQLFGGIFYCLAIPFGIYLIVLLMRLVITLRSYEIQLIRNITNYKKIFEPFQLNIKLKEGEKTTFVANRAQLKVRDRFKFQVYVLISDRGVYIHGGVLSLKKYFTTLTRSEFNPEGGYSFFSLEDIRSVTAINKGKKILITLVLKNEKSFLLFVPSDDFNWNSFPKGLLKNY